jgi:hypothetical protein
MKNTGISRYPDFLVLDSAGCPGSAQVVMREDGSEERENGACFDRLAEDAVSG